MNWLERFTPREQISLLALAAALTLYAIYGMVWQPLQSMRSEMERRNTATAQVLQRVDVMVSEILQLRSSGERTGGTGNLTSLINRTTAQVQLSVSRLQPNSRGEIQVRFESADFDQILRWLHSLELEHGVLVNEVALSQSGASGRVNATIRLAQGS